MKLISWNLWAENKNQSPSVDKLISEHDPDIICLQEVTVDCLKYLKQLPDFEIIVAQDFNSFKKKTKKEYKLVILSKYQILNKDRENSFSVAHLTRRSVWDLINKWQESLEFQYADVEYNEKLHRIFNIHLEVAAGPKLRYNQLLATLKKFDKNAVNIICGDLNVYATFWLNLVIGWAMGYRPTEIFTNERKLFEKQFKKSGLKNIFKGRKTYPKYRLQLDHILIPNEVKTKSSEVIAFKNGSDHLAIKAEF
jgi:endonuclease/exonuclease/phosphatase family metal-dependent hydrolase